MTVNSSGWPTVSRWLSSRALLSSAASPARDRDLKMLGSGPKGNCGLDTGGGGGGGGGGLLGREPGGFFGFILTGVLLGGDSLGGSRVFSELPEPGTRPCSCALSSRSRTGSGCARWLLYISNSTLRGLTAS